VWGAGLGAIVLIFVGGFFFFTQINGGSGSTCDSALKDIGNAPQADAAGFSQVDTALGQLIISLNKADLNAANAEFYGPTHNFMHTADPAIRPVNEQLGKKLCEAVIKFETDFDTSGRTSLGLLANEVATIRNLLRDGAVALGFPRPSG
jgi:hypothetical protein